MLSEEELYRYDRQIQLNEIGINGQKKLLNSKVLVIGAGGLGSPILIYLSASGIGKIGIVDGDKVDMHNLHRQIIHPTKNVGMLKTKSAQESILSINSNINVIDYPYFLTESNIEKIVKNYDIVINAVDNFETRYLVNDSCIKYKKPLIDASIFKFYGQISVYMPEKGCYSCQFPEKLPNDVIPSTDQSGIFGPLAGLMGIFQASEAIKVLLGIGQPIIGRTIFVDLLKSTFKTIEWKKNKTCASCA